MDTSLQSTNLTAVGSSAVSDQDATKAKLEEEQHVHLPNPSFWPIILSIAVVVTMSGVLFFPDNPWLSIAGAPFVLISMVAWALEDPMASHEDETHQAEQHVHLTPDEVLAQAEEVLERTVTVSSTAYSAHPVRVEIDAVEGEGVVLALYGKVELEAQRQVVEDEMWEIPNVVNVKNFIVAEDAILNLAYARIDNMRAKGKLEGAKNISVLVENYILSLYGDVPNSDMKLALEREMIGIPGVRVVINHIGLDENIPGNLGRTRNKI
ncbi:MAG: BON domain-containing protein [Chloroflexi bacterium]|nr:BON domain-containing protein [Ktedonobacteraceae bacterium]MBV9709106.1 BON domain-containing protein [Chloroflexota bacterium]